MADYVPLVAVEGRDGVGKSTLVSNLASFFRERANCIRFPTREGPFSAAIYDHLLEREPLDPTAFALLCAADRQQSARAELAEGELRDVVIADRYMHSGIAYAIAAGVDPEFACLIEAEQVLPTAVLFLEMPNEDATERLRARNAKSGAPPLSVESEERQARVVDGFEAAFRSYPVKLYRLDARLPADELALRAASIIEILIAE